MLHQFCRLWRRKSLVESELCNRYALTRKRRSACCLFTLLRTYFSVAHLNKYNYTATFFSRWQMSLINIPSTVFSSWLADPKWAGIAHSVYLHVGRSGFWFRAGTEVSLLHCDQTVSVAYHPHIQWVHGTQSLVVNTAGTWNWPFTIRIAWNYTIILKSSSWRGA